MIQFFSSLFGKSAAGHPVKKSVPVAKTRTAGAVDDYRAVSFAPGLMCCESARRAKDKQYLWREAPRLPLPNCANPQACSCKFRKTADRRSDERRLFGGSETGRWYAGVEQRTRRGRRSTEG